MKGSIRIVVAVLLASLVCAVAVMAETPETVTVTTAESAPSVQSTVVTMPVPLGTTVVTRVEFVPILPGTNPAAFGSNVEWTVQFVGDALKRQRLGEGYDLFRYVNFSIDIKEEAHRRAGISQTEFANRIRGLLLVQAKKDVLEARAKGWVPVLLAKYSSLPAPYALAPWEYGLTEPEVAKAVALSTEQVLRRFQQDDIRVDYAQILQDAAKDPATMSLGEGSEIGDFITRASLKLDDLVPLWRWWQQMRVREAAAKDKTAP